MNNAQERQNERRFRLRLGGPDIGRMSTEDFHFCSSECPETKVFEEHEYQLKEAQRKIWKQRQN